MVQRWQLTLAILVGLAMLAIVLLMAILPHHTHHWF